MKTFYLSLLALFTLLFAAGCIDDDDVNPAVELNVPDTFAFARDGESTVSFSGQTDRIAMAEELIDALLDEDQSLEALNNMFRNPEGVDPFTDPALNESTKALRSKVAAGAALYGQNAVLSAEIRADFDGWLAAQHYEVFPAWNQLDVPGQPGQIADGSSVRYVNAWGLEYNQAFAKSLIGALMVDQINNNYLTAGVLDGNGFRAANDAGTLAEGKAYTDMEHRWDEAFGYLFGASATPATPLTDLEDADSFLNKYLGRVEGDEDYAGIAAEIEEAFRTGRQAIVQRAYDERDDEAERIMQRLDDVIAIRAIYYLKNGQLALRGGDFGGAFHDLSEAYGFVYSLRFVADTDGGNADLADRVLTALRNADGNGFWDLEDATLETLAAEVGAAFGVDVAEAANN